MLTVSIEALVEQKQQEDAAAFHNKVVLLVKTVLWELTAENSNEL